MTDLNASINFDKKLYDADIKASIYHTEMLANQNIINKNEAALIKVGLLKIKKEITRKQNEIQK